MTKVLVTGSSGYVGSHVAAALVDEGYYVEGLDPLEAQVTGLPTFTTTLQELSSRFLWSHYDVVVHAAAYIFPRDSVQCPQEYYENNLESTLAALRMVRHGGHFVLASTGSALDPASPYSHSKIMCERIVQDVAAARGLTHTSFRFFNVAGSLGYGRVHPTTHLVSRAIHCAMTDEILTINGGDYPTRDGTCVRDYVHPGDIAQAVVRSIKDPGGETLGNLASVRTDGLRGYSCLEVVDAVSRLSMKDVRVKVGPRVPGDAPEFVAPDLSKYNVGRYGLDEMIEQELRRYGT